MLPLDTWRPVAGFVGALCVIHSKLRCPQGTQSNNLIQTIPVTWDNRIYWVVSIYWMEPHSSAIYHLWQKMSLALHLVLDQYGCNLTSNLMSKIWCIFATWLDNMLCLTVDNKILHYCHCMLHLLTYWITGNLRLSEAVVFKDLRGLVFWYYNYLGYPWAYTFRYASFVFQ